MNKRTGCRSRPTKLNTKMHNENIAGSEPFPNDAPHNMPLRQFSGWGLALETELARAFGNLLAGCPPLSATQGRHDHDGMATSPSTPPAADAPMRTAPPPLPERFAVTGDHTRR